VSDIIYPSKERLLIFDNRLNLYDRKIIGWSLSSRMSVKHLWRLGEWLLKIEALRGLVFHSDRGVQYASKKFTNVIDSYKMITV
jgi:transposase InsO family protein